MKNYKIDTDFPCQAGVKYHIQRYVFNGKKVNKNMSVEIGQKAPNFGVSEWIQGAPTNFDQEKDHVVLLDVFQVNCPGCFMHAIPEAINIYNKYKDEGVRVLGLATAFEDFDKNTLDNLKLLAETGEVIGETKNALSMYGQLKEGNKLSYKIPFLCTKIVDGVPRSENFSKVSAENSFALR